MKKSRRLRDGRQKRRSKNGTNEAIFQYGVTIEEENVRTEINTIDN